MNAAKVHEAIDAAFAREVALIVAAQKPLSPEEMVKESQAMIAHRIRFPRYHRERPDWT